METLHNPALRDRYIREKKLKALFSTEMPNFMLLHYSPGDLLTTPFSPSQMLQFVVEGDVLLYQMPDEESFTSIPTTYNEVSVLGDVELINAHFMPFFVEAKTDVYTLAVGLEHYRQQLLGDPVFLCFLCRNFADKLNGAVASTRRFSLRERVGRSLMLAEPGQQITDIARLAGSINVSPRQLIRVMKEFCEAGVLAHEKKGVYRVLKKPEKI